MSTSPWSFRSCIRPSSTKTCVMTIIEAMGRKTVQMNSQKVLDYLDQAGSVAYPRHPYLIGIAASITTHPYRSLLTNTSFPRCHLTFTPGGHTESFVRSLFPLGNGFPMWDPTGSISRPEVNLKEGIRIGDVGLVSDEGDFIFFFNIFLSKTDPYQAECPPEHEPLLPAVDAPERAFDRNYFPSATVLFSSGISVARLSESPLDLLFTIRAREGGIVVLPDGGTREDLASTSQLLPYVRKHALEWYRFINKSASKHPYPNGTLYLITGCDRAKAWAIAAIPEATERIGQTTSIRYQQTNKHPWDDNPAVSAKRHTDRDPRIESSPIFIRGMRIAIDARSWNKEILRNEPPNFIPHFNLLAVPVLGIRARLLTMIERWRHYPEHFGPIDTKVIFHPLSIICRILLDECPDAAVAVAEDSIWSSISDKPQDGALDETVKHIAKILEACVIEMEDGLVTLRLKTSPPSVPNPQGWNVVWHISEGIKDMLRTRRRRKEILRQVSKALPGPDYKEIPVPYN